MRSSRKRPTPHISGRLLAAGALLLLAAAPASAREAKAAISAAVAPTGQGSGSAGGFDGHWVINASTASFFCPVRHKQLVAEVRGGRLTRLSGLPGSASGHVAPDGAVTISLRVYGSTATITGHIAGQSGGGQWSANNLICSKGGWTASR